MVHPAFIKYALLSFPVTCFGLGAWQVKRLKWKKDLIADMDNRLVEDVFDLSSLKSLDELIDLEYRRVKVRGEYDKDPEHQVTITPSQIVVNEEAIGRGMVATLFGSHVVTRFKAENPRIHILVNRGFLPFTGKQNSKNSMNIGLGEEGEIIEVIGILRHSSQPGLMAAKDHQLVKKDWLFRDVEGIAKVLRTAPIFIDLIEDKNRTEGPVGGQTRLTVRNEHLNYAITWFSLSFFSALMWYSMYVRKAKIR